MNLGCSGSIALFFFFGYANLAGSENCGSDYFQCKNGVCILSSSVCNDIYDCPDGEDEYNCHDIKCVPPTWFQCKNGRCIASLMFCDGDRDCSDGSDEPVNCTPDSHHFTTEKPEETCSSDEFMCLDKKCIKRSWLCDGEPDCSDGSDETVECDELLDCSDGFRCKNKHCIVKEFHCDGVDDCGDNSDEESCSTHFYSPDHCITDHGFFLCADRIACIEEKDVCDGFPHCFDKSDEADCLQNQQLNQSYCQSLGCSHSCHLAPHGQINCTCEKGFKLAQDEKMCIDIDECLEFGFCHQGCKNLNGSFECSCDEGYVLQSDRRTCKASGGEALLLFSSFSRIRGIYLNTEVYFTVAKDLNHVIGISHNGHYVYWTDISHGEVAIYRATESGSDIEMLVNSGLGIPEDLAVDYVTNNIYFTDRRNKHIGVCTETGMSCAVLNNEDIDRPRGIVLYPQKGIMFWSDWGKTAMIATSGMDGSNPRPLVYRNLKWPNGLALDYSNDRLYWVDAKALTIETVRLDGSDRQVVLKNAVKHPFSIAIFEDMLYWSDWDSHEIQKCNKFTGKNHTWVVKEKKKSTIFGVHIYHPVNHPRIDNPCRENRCSDICLLTPNMTYACACPSHSTLGPDMSTCKLRSKPLLVAVGGSNKLFLLSPLHLGRQSNLEIKLPDVHLIGCLAYDSLSGSVLISDSKLHKVFRFNLETKEVTTLIHSHLGYINSMSFDSYGNNLYMTDLELKRVNVWSMSKSTLVTIYKTYHGDIPESIVVVPEHAVFFLAISRADGSISISRVNMDGTQVLPHIAGGHIHGPKISLSYDQKTQKVYWTDSNAEVIESMNIDGSNRKRVLTVEGTPISITSHNGIVFWVRRGSPNLYFYDETEFLPDYDRPENVFRMSVDDENYLSLVVVGEIDSKHLHPCQDRDDCSHVCLVSSAYQGTCHCPMGMHLDLNHRTCLAQASCNEKQFKCRTDDMCIANVQRCDGHKDCPSGDDEIECEMFHCKDDQFKCTNGQCIAIRKKCDNEYDCSDHSDELNCASNCTEYTFQCGTGECIPSTWRCDFIKDCPDTSDEHGCSNVCPNGTFSCKSGTCIPKSWECDDFPDCSDGTDEHENCHKETCKQEEMLCKNGRCVSKAMECDGMDDCGDGTDESSCTASFLKSFLYCLSNEMLCEFSSKCVPLKSRCNGTAECPRGEDEMDCSNCLEDEFQCKNKKCVYKKWVCDKQDDCGDHSDEDPAMCKNWESSEATLIAQCDEFHCLSGECIPMYLVCNHVKNCQDGSDEGPNCEEACKSSSCSQICLPTPVSGRCACHGGFVLNSDGYTCTDIDECAEGRCSQLCANTPGSYNCSCLPDYSLTSDRMTCKATGGPMSYIISSDDQVRILSHNFNSVDFLVYEPGTNILGITLDTRRKLLYWSSGVNHRINVMNVDGKDKSFIIGAGQPGKLSLDWVTNNIYYIDNSDSAVIRVCNMAEKKYSDVVHVNHGFVISNLFFNPISGVLYYSKVQPFTLTRPISEIIKYSASERNSSVLVGTDVSWVSGFAFDYVRQYLYWSDLHNQVIEKIRFDGKDRQIVFRAEVYRPESLVFFEDHLYWLTKGSGIIKKCKIFGDHKGSCHTIPFYIHDIRFMSIMQEALQPNVTNPCRNYCDSTSLCVLTLGGPKCVCEDGTVLPRQKTCDASQMTLSNEIIARYSENNLRQYLSHEKPPLSGSSSAVIGILMTALIVCIAFASYLYVKKRKSRVILETMHFQNPSYGLSHVKSSYHPNELTPGEHQYENPTSKLVRHPDGKYEALTREKEEEERKNCCKYDIPEYESDSDLEDRIDMKANLIP